MTLAETFDTHIKAISTADEWEEYKAMVNTMSNAEEIAEKGMNTKKVILIMILLYPIILFCAFWNAYYKYIRTVVDNGISFVSYRKGIRNGIKELINTHHRIYNRLKNEKLR